MNRVIFDMRNKNSLISLAYIKVNDNPLQVFCHYILVLLLKAPEQSLRADLLKSKLFNTFGLDMPQQLINNCISLLEKSGDVVKLPSGAGYKVGQTTFDIDNFERTILYLNEQEDKLLSSLMAFVKDRFGQNWSKDEARNHLSSFLGKEGYGAQLFLQQEISVEAKSASFSWYIGRYINHVQRENGIEKKCLEEIVNGMMVLQGITLTGDYQQNKNQKFRGTVFYFDTRLVLRALGFSWKAQVDSARDMVKLLLEKYEAKIGIFPQTLREVQNALAAARSAFQKHKPIADYELKLYSELYPEKAAIEFDHSTNVIGLLQRVLKIDSPTLLNWDDDDTQKYTIDTVKIANYIEKQCGWRRGAINNDVEIINQINILRKGDYTRHYGGRSKLPVFVTSNSKLSHTFREYITNSEEDGREWNAHALPVISDNMLLYRIWIPFATEFSDLPALTLSRFAYSAQNEGFVFFEKFREMAKTLDQTQNVDIIDITELTRMKLEDILIRNTNGNLEQMTDAVVATSLEEYVKLSNLNLRVENETLSKRADERDSQVIELLAKRYVNKLGVWRIMLFFSRIWWLLAFAVLFGITSLCNAQIYWYGVSIVPVVIQLFQFAMDKLVDDRGWRFTVYRWMLTYVKKKYINKISTRIKKAGYEDDLDAVIEYCLKHTKVFAALGK